MKLVELLEQLIVFNKILKFGIRLNVLNNGDIKRQLLKEVYYFKLMIYPKRMQRFKYLRQNFDGHI